MAIDSDATNLRGRDGDRLFAAIGCASYPVPSLVTGPSSDPLFSRQQVPLFSDLLLHNGGTGDGIRLAAAQPDEIRTPALWCSVASAAPSRRQCPDISRRRHAPSQRGGTGPGRNRTPVAG